VLRTRVTTERQCQVRPGYNSDAALRFSLLLWGEMNMKQPFECIRCHAHMEAGYVPDYREGRFSQQSWWPGKPTNSFWMGLKLAKDQKDQVVPVTTLRCPKCGYLESYAIPKSSSDQ